MKRGANTRNQDTEAGSRYPSILRTNSTEKTVKLNRVGDNNTFLFLFHVCLVLKFITWRDRSRSQRDWRLATSAAPSVWTTWWHSGLRDDQLQITPAALLQKYEGRWWPHSQPVYNVHLNIVTTKKFSQPDLLPSFCQPFPRVAVAVYNNLVCAKLFPEL